MENLIPFNAKNSLSKKAQYIQEYLENKGLATEVLELSSSTRTAQEAAASIGCDVAQIVKSLLFRTKETQKPILVLVSGKNRVNETKLEHILAEPIEKADGDFTKIVTGFAIGGVPPIGHLQALDTFIDEDLLKYEIVWAAAGTPFAVFKLSSKDLVTLTQGKIICTQ